jgi:uncharacterized protein YkwD
MEPAPSASNGYKRRVSAQVVSRGLRRMAGRGLLLAMVVGGVLFAGLAAGGSGPARAQSCSGGLAETTICLVNEARTARGLRPFAVSGELAAAARAHSADMVARQYFAFDSPDGSTPHTRARQAGYGAGATGFAVVEAIGWGTGEEGSPNAIVQKWLVDPQARPVILSTSNRDIGVGVAAGSPQRGAANSTTYTADVGRLGSPLSPTPQFAKNVAVKPVQGVVLVQLPGGASRARAARFTPLTGARLVPVGAVLDTTRGRVRLVSSRGRGKGTQSVVLHSGLFKASQSRRGRGLTEFRLAGPRLACGSGARAAARRQRRLWARGRGAFRTRGGSAAATVRGTVWLTLDTCRGTLIRVRSGTVSVRDLRRNRTVVVRAGRSVLIRR